MILTMPVRLSTTTRNRWWCITDLLPQNFLNSIWINLDQIWTLDGLVKEFILPTLLPRLIITVRLAERPDRAYILFFSILKTHLNGAKRQKGSAAW